MDTVFLVAAAAGGTLIALQLLAGALGLGGDHGDASHHDFGAVHDADHPADGHGDSNWFLGLLTFRSICAAITFFGLGGLVAIHYKLPESAQLGSAFLGGIGALYLVATLMKMLYRLKADGTVRIKNSIGRVGTVYLRVPGQKSGPGKVTLNLQNRTVELEAYTAADELPTGSPVRVVAVIGPNSVEVASEKESGVPLAQQP